MTITMRRFVAEDWYGFAGAEAFEDGSEPFIGELKVDGQDALLVHDRFGIEMIVARDADDDVGVTWRREAGAAVLSAIVGFLKPEMTEAELMALGLVVVC